MFYSRLKNAIREQNWFAVVLEIVIVVLGVVIGFQITAWSERQADLTTERSYLSQIDPIPNDSILVLISNSFAALTLNPVLGTIEALINTGDLTLIRNDSLRLAIPSYLERQKSMVVFQNQVQDEMMAALGDLSQIVDMAHANAVEAKAGGTIEVPSPQVNTSNPDYFTTTPFPFSAAEFRNSVEAYNIVYQIHHWKIQANMMRRTIAQQASELNNMISKELSK